MQNFNITKIQLSFMSYDDEFVGAAQRNRDKQTLKQGRVFGQTHMDPVNRGRKRTGTTAGGWSESDLW